MTFHKRSIPLRGLRVGSVRISSLRRSGERTLAHYTDLSSRGHGCNALALCVLWPFNARRQAARHVRHMPGLLLRGRRCPVSRRELFWLAEQGGLERKQREQFRFGVSDQQLLFEFEALAAAFFADVALDTEGHSWFEDPVVA
jgi:hypothetical protein